MRKTYAKTKCCAASATSASARARILLFSRIESLDCVSTRSRSPAHTTQPRPRPVTANVSGPDGPVEANVDTVPCSEMLRMGLPDSLSNGSSEVTLEADAP